MWHIPMPMPVEKWWWWSLSFYMNEWSRLMSHWGQRPLLRGKSQSLTRRASPPDYLFIVHSLSISSSWIFDTFHLFLPFWTNVVSLVRWSTLHIWYLACLCFSCFADYVWCHIISSYIGRHIVWLHFHSKFFNLFCGLPFSLS